MRDPALWEKIRAHGLPSSRNTDSHAGLGALAQRLGDAERWSSDYATRAVEEYCRFVYLARISDRQVTPSGIIDRVWHEHVTDSRAYVDAFCKPLFGEILHHEPGNEPDDVPRFETQYAATRALYAAEFGQDPPDDVWIYRDPEQRAGDKRQARLAFWGSKLFGLVLGVLLYLLFGWITGALFLACVAGVIAELVLAPRVPGPRYRSGDGDSSGCGSCGGD